MQFQISFNSGLGKPSFGQESSVGPYAPNLVSITGKKKVPKTATSLSWQIEASAQSAWGGTYLLAMVVANESGETSIDPGSFLQAAPGNFFVPEADWILPTSANAEAGTAWVAVPPAQDGCTLNIISNIILEDPDGTETFEVLLYFYSVDIGLWWAKSHFKLPKNA